MRKKTVYVEGACGDIPHELWQIRRFAAAVIDEAARDLAGRLIVHREMARQFFFSEAPAYRIQRSFWFALANRREPPPKEMAYRLKLWLATRCPEKAEDLHPWEQETEDDRG